MASSYLGLDLGTSSVKAVILAAGGRRLATARAGYPTRSPVPGHTETDPAAWWSSVGQVVREVVASADATPTVVGLSGQMHGLVLCADDGHPLRPAILWPDTRATAELELYRHLPGEALTRLANPLSPGMAGPVLRWLAAHEPAVLETARWALQPKDWLRLRLTGSACSEPSDASATLLYDLLGDGWDHTVIEALDLDPRLLPELVPSTSVAGELSPSAADALGLAPGLPVVAGAADTAAAMFGTGLGSPGLVQLTLGTGGQIVTPLAEPRADPRAGTHLYRSASHHGWYAMAATLNAGLALDWVRRLLGVEWAELYTSAQLPVVAGDPLFLPHLVGERTPYLDPQLRGAWLGLAPSHDRASLLRSALEGVAFALRDGLDALFVGAEPWELRLAGGGSENPAWRALIADVLGQPLYSAAVSDASARGAALIGAIGAGEMTEEDVHGQLAPPVTLAAEPRDGRSRLHEERLRWFRDEVRHRLQAPPT